MLVTITYDKLSEFQYYCQKNQIQITKSEYGEQIICFIELNRQQKQEILQESVKKKLNIQKTEIIQEKYIKR